MVNIPKGEWFCSACALHRPGSSNAQISFEKYSANMCNQHGEIFKYLGLPYKNAGDFFSIHSEAISLILDPKSAVKQRALRQQVQCKHTVFDVGKVKFVRKLEKNDWRLPTPLLSEEAYVRLQMYAQSAHFACLIVSCCPCWN